MDAGGAKSSRSSDAPRPKVRMLKIIALGKYAVGKTSLIRNFADVNFVFTAQYKATIGLETISKTIDVEGEQVQLQIWDTAGQERFNSITEMFYRGADALLLVFDITDASSFEVLPRWKDDFYRSGGVDMNAPCAVIANKVDRAAVDRRVSRKKALSWINFVSGSSASSSEAVSAPDAGATSAATAAATAVATATATAAAVNATRSTQDSPQILYFETSAKDSTNVEQAFRSLAIAAAKRQKMREAADVAAMGKPSRNVLQQEMSPKRRKDSATTKSDSCC